MNDFIKHCIKKEVTEFENKTKNFKPDISVCVLTYQHANYISKCLDGILMQKTNFKFEIILGEDESSDGTREICIEYAKKYPEKIRLFLHSRKNVIYINGVPTGRFNFVYNISKARGKYIALCEGDDYWTDPNKLQKQVEFLETHQDFAMTSHAVKTVYEGVEEKNPFVKPMKVANFEDFADKKHFIPTLSIVFRKDALPTIPIWFKDLWAGDIPLILLLSYYGKNYYINEVMGLKCKHTGGRSQQSGRKTKEFKKYFAKNRLFFYEKLNEFFNYKKSRVLNPIIAKYHLYVMYIDFMNKNFEKSFFHFVKSFYYYPGTFFDILLKIMTRRSIR